MLPIYPLDGGQIFRSLLWYVFGRANSLFIASIVGFIGVGILVIIVGRLFLTESLFYAIRLACNVILHHFSVAGAAYAKHWHYQKLPKPRVAKASPVPSAKLRRRWEIFGIVANAASRSTPLERSAFAPIAPLNISIPPVLNAATCVLSPNGTFPINHRHKFRHHYHRRRNLTKTFRCSGWRTSTTFCSERPEPDRRSKHKLWTWLDEKFAPAFGVRQSSAAFNLLSMDY